MVLERAKNTDFRGDVYHFKTKVIWIRCLIIMEWKMYFSRKGSLKISQK